MLTSLFFNCWTWRTQGELHLAEFFALSAIVVVTWLAGRSFLLILGANTFLDRTFPFVFLSGMTVVGLVVSSVHVMADISLAMAFALVAMGSLAIDIALARRLAEWHDSRQSRWYGLLTTITCLFAATFWMQHCFPQWVISEQIALYRGFDEYFAHCSNLMPLLTPGSPFARGSIDYAGEPLSFYHWASYSFPALLSKLGGQPANDTLASLWYPMGTFVIGLSSASLGQIFAGRRAGFLACILTVVIPDPTYWQSDIVFFSFHRLLEASPGMGYACAAAMVAFAWTVMGLRSGRSLLVFSGILAGFGAGFFKVNIIVAVLPAILMAMLLVPFRFGSAGRGRFIFLLLVMVAGLYLAGSRVRSAPTFSIDRDLGKRYVETVSEFLPSDTPIATLGDVARSASGWLAGSIRFVFVLFATFQAYIILYLVAVAIAAWRSSTRPRKDQFFPFGLQKFLPTGLRWYELLTVASLVFYGLLAVGLAPNENGDPFELQHRSFCWYYMLLGVGLACQLTGLVDFTVRRFYVRGRFRYVVGMLALLLPLMLGRISAMPVPDIAYDVGYYRAARHIRENSSSDDVVVDSFNDPWQATVALSERRAFVCRDDSYNFPGSGVLRDVRRRRREESDRLFSLSDKASIIKWSQENRVRWCLLHPQTNVAWPADFLASPSFESRKYRVYDLTR